MSSKRVFLKIESTELTVEEIIEKATAIGAGQLQPGRFHIQFFDELMGFYTPEQIEKRMNKLRHLEVSAQNVKAHIINGSAGNYAESANRGLEALLQELRISSILD